MLKHTPALLTLVVVVASGWPAAVRAQDGPLKVEALQEGPPEGLEAPIKEVLQAGAIRVLDGQGKPFADLWLRKAVAATGEPAGPKGAILFPFFEVGELIGAVRFNETGYDYRDQQIDPGVYTLRYGRQPVDGDHLGVSTYRDYLMLVPADQDIEPTPIDQETLNIISADAARTNHPAVFILVAAPDGAADGPAAVHDAAKDQWGVVLLIPIQVEGQAAPTQLKAQLILVGHGPV